MNVYTVVEFYVFELGDGSREANFDPTGLRTCASNFDKNTKAHCMILALFCAPMETISLRKGSERFCFSRKYPTHAALSTSTS